jgi:hypothetical protein
MSTQSIARPGLTVQTTLAELLNFEQSRDVVVEWERRMRDIKESERNAENEEASVRIH